MISSLQLSIVWLCHIEDCIMNLVYCDITVSLVSCNMILMWDMMLGGGGFTMVSLSNL
jgi:hypothetical protein